MATFQGIGAALSASPGGAMAIWLGWGPAFLGRGVSAVFALLLAFHLLGQASRLNAAAISARV